MTAKKITLRNFETAHPYSHFLSLDGDHPWMQAVPEGYVSYRVRELNRGRVTYFNYVLAKEMGLISPHHPHCMNADLESVLLKTFSLQIINEYDELSGIKVDPNSIKPKRYMATRYLQLQHSNKQGKTSGDGRGIWNGVVQHNGKIWDISSRGTGVTCLAPGAVAAKRPLKTGNTEFGYGCGQAEIDELYGAAILAENMHLQGIPTERVLCIIDLGSGVGIGVRAAPNLIRPAHLFLYLKQERYDLLKRATDYFIERQITNKKWYFKYRDHRKYEELAEKVCESFAEFAARLDIDYVFAWLDWDGDNVLADAGIIDYGSVRQFGIRHDKYRYDDVERFSTNLNEQRLKARLIVQTFVQLCDYLRHGQRKPLKNFAHHPIVLKFNRLFSDYRADRLLYRIGFTSSQRERILAKHRDLFDLFDRQYSRFERAKVSGKEERVADGVNHPALFNMREFLRKYPSFLLARKEDFQRALMSTQDFFPMILSSFAKKRDARMTQSISEQIENLQHLYKELVLAAVGSGSLEKALPEICRRSSLLNGDSRITGNALIEIVDEIIEEQKRGLPLHRIQKIIDRLILQSAGMPELPTSRYYEEPNQLQRVVPRAFYRKLMQIVHINRETI
ncbi:MAG: protein adenylyltransferase SelO family protein [Bdellovibrionaceae bacterium]|nr:protein adenylyltransferase SelO family protein [Pseudobdellovibrionaceae bacterium]